MRCATPSRVPRSPRRPAAPLLALLLPAAACVGCGAEPTLAEAPVTGGHAVVLLPSPLQGMNPLAVTQNRSIQVQREVLFAPLVRYDRRLHPRPWLAESWDTTALGGDTLQLTLRLRADVAWHDGTPVSARDVTFTYARMRDQAVPYAFRSEVGPYEAAPVVLDERTVRFRLRRHPEFLEVWYQTPLLPAHLLARVAPGELAEDPFWDAPVGNGPFRFAGRSGDGSWTFAANDDFPAELGGRPRLDSLTFRPVPEGREGMEGMARGEADLLLDLAPPQVERVWSARTLHMVTFPGTQWTFVAWNNRVPVLADVRVRRALDRALDRRALVDSVLRGLGEPGRATVTPAHWAYASEPEPRADTAEARRLLAAAGWVDRDGGGLATNDAGTPLRLSLLTNDARAEVAARVARQLRRVGVDVAVDTLSFGDLTGRLAGRVTPSGRARDFDAALVGWADPIGKNDADLLHSRAFDEPNGFVGYRSAVADSLLGRLGGEVDEAWAREAWRRYQALVREDAPLSVLFYPLQLAVRSDRLRGVEMDARGTFPTVATWWLAPEASGSAAPRN